MNPPSAGRPESESEFAFVLYVAGTNARSLRAVESVSRLCHQHLEGRYDLRVVDIYQHPELAEAGQVIAAPTLVRSRPMPVRHVVGDMSEEAPLLRALGVRGAA